MTDGTGSVDGPRKQVWRAIAVRLPFIAMIATAAIFTSQLADLDIGSLTSPGPGYWPRVLVVALAGISVVGLVMPGGNDFEQFTPSGTGRAFLGFAVLVGFTLLFEQVGLIISGFLFVMVWLKALNGETWRMSLAVAVLAPVACYLLFVMALGIRLPNDLVASLWGGR